MVESNILRSVYIDEYILIPGQCLIFISKSPLTLKALIITIADDIANFIPSFPDTFRFGSIPPESKIIFANHRTSQHRDLYLNKHCRYRILTSAKVPVYIIFGYFRNFNRQIGLIA